MLTLKYYNPDDNYSEFTLRVYALVEIACSRVMFTNNQ